MDEVKSGSVLIVDDEDTNIMALSHILGPDYEILAVKDGQDAIEIAEEYHPDVILLDIVMPDMDGYAVIAALKSSEKTQDIPVIFITGLSETADEEKGFLLGASDYIGKPFSPAIVKLRVQNQIKIIQQTQTIIEKETSARSSRAKSEFLSRMSHEIRTPMNAIMGMTTLAIKAADEEKRSDMLEKVSNASRHLLEMIDNVLDMSDIEDGNFQLTCSGFSFSGMVREIADKAGPDFCAKQQAFETNIDASIPDMLTGDEQRLAQVIMSLLSNACKFTPEGGSISLAASMRGESATQPGVPVQSRQDGPLTILIEVADSGIGISKEHRDRIFAPFEQADGGIDRKFGGAGIGLAIAKHIVGLMDGELAIESEPGKGSRFSFEFKTQASSPPADNNLECSLSGMVALLVEDVEINREIVLAMLEDTGLTIDCAENGAEALEMFSSDPGKYDVILMDINMPVMDGVEATRRIRELGTQEAQRIPIIALTANVIKSEVETYFKAGMTGHIGKPVAFDILLSTLRNHKLV